MEIKPNSYEFHMLTNYHWISDYELGTQDDLLRAFNNLSDNGYITQLSGYNGFTVPSWNPTDKGMEYLKSVFKPLSKRLAEEATHHIIESPYDLVELLYDHYRITIMMTNNSIGLEISADSGLASITQANNILYHVDPYLAWCLEAHNRTTPFTDVQSEIHGIDANGFPMHILATYTSYAPPHIGVGYEIDYAVIREAYNAIKHISIGTRLV